MKTGLSRLRLTNFRSYEALDLSFGAEGRPVALCGPNGVGKTNILEGISYLTSGRGLRAARLSDVARRCGDDVHPLWSVVANLYSPFGEHIVGTGMVEGAERRQMRIDGKQTSKQSDLADVFRCLWLTPAQDRLFCGDPNARRRFLDRIVQAFDPLHANRLSDYQSAMKQWLCLLREGRIEEGWLSALEQQLVENGIAIAASRLDIVERVSVFLSVTEDKSFPAAEIQLVGLLEKALLSQSAVDVEDMFMGHLRNARKICAEGGNVTGPHTADFVVIHRQQNRTADMCSTGEQKALLISIILAEMRAQMAEQGKCPVLLLDEVAAHLDRARRRTLFDILIDRPAQVFMTTTDCEIFEDFTGQIDQFGVEENKEIIKVA